MLKSTLISIVIFIVSVVAALGAAELVLRFKNSSMKNYDIEMWRYARELKTPSPNPTLGHEHIPNSSSVLQSVEIRLNEMGMRGGPVPPPTQHRRILFLGASATLGWGVPEEETVSARVEQLLRAGGEQVEVFNGGIGNYNAERYVELFFTKLKEVKPTDIVVHYFLRDAEKLEAGGGNFFLRNSQLAVTLWIAGNRLYQANGNNSLIDHYKQVYQEDQPGYRAMVAGLTKLADYARENGINIYLAMMPDLSSLADYPFAFAHQQVQEVATRLGYTFVDLRPALGPRPPEEVWAMAGDPHPNSLAHRLMAEAIYPVVAQPPD